MSIMPIVYYVLSGHTDQDFSESWPAHDVWSDAELAEQIAEDYYDSDPGDPSDFSCTVGIRRSMEDPPSWFKVTAEVSVSFSASRTMEIPND